MGKRKPEEVLNFQKDNCVILYTLGNQCFRGFLFWKGTEMYTSVWLQYTQNIQAICKILNTLIGLFDKFGTFEESSDTIKRNKKKIIEIFER